MLYAIMYMEMPLDTFSNLQTGGNLPTMLWHIPQLDWGVHIHQCSKSDALCPSSCWFSCTVISMHSMFSDWAGKNTYAGKFYNVLWLLMDQVTSSTHHLLWGFSLLVLLVLNFCILPSQHFWDYFTFTLLIWTCHSLVFLGAEIYMNS